MANRKITWETTTSTDIGIDATLFGKLNITADYFYKVTDDILMKLNVPLIIGMDAPSQNAGKMENRGWEVSVSYADQVGDFNYRASFNISDVRNKILDMRGVNQTGLTVNREGYEMYSIYGLEAIGYIQPEDYDAEGNYLGATQYGNFGPGDIKYKDLNGDGTIDDNDQTYYSGIYPNNPQLVYGFGLNVQYKGIYAGVFFQGVGKTSVNLKANTSYFVPFANGKDQSSARVQAADHWTASDPNNMNVLYPRLHTNEYSNNTLNSTWWYRDGSFLRLKNVELGYQFDKKLVQRWKMQNLRIYVQGSNLAVWDHVKMWDPEIGNSGARYPINATWTFGLDVTF